MTLAIVALTVVVLRYHVPVSLFPFLFYIRMQGEPWNEAATLLHSKTPKNDYFDIRMVICKE